MVHVNVNKPHHCIFFDSHPIEAMENEGRRETSIAGEFLEIDRVADFLQRKPCRFLNCLGNQLTLSGHRRHLATRANARGARARAETMVDLFVRSDSSSGDESDGASERDRCE